MGRIILPFKENPKITTIVALGYGHSILHLENGSKELVLPTDAYERGRFYLADSYDEKGFPIFEKLETVRRLNAIAKEKWLNEQNRNNPSNSH